MQIEKRLLDIIDNVYAGKAPTKEDVIYMFSFPEASLESNLIRAAADHIVRRDSDNAGIILGQIGVDVRKCPGGCQFCSFGDDRTQVPSALLSDTEIRKKAEDFTRGGDLYALYLMTMHDYDPDVLFHAIDIVKPVLPETTNLWVNIGDSSLDRFRELKRMGVSGVYHVCRLGEGKCTKLAPEDRIRTMRNAIDAGLELYTCVEPIGPEHTPEDLADALFIGLDLGITQQAAMRRVAVPGTPLYHYGQISELRLAQIVGVVELASCCFPTIHDNGVHEPNTLGLTSGANQVTAETGGNPRDNNAETDEGRGMDMDACRRMLLECGYDKLKLGDGSTVALNDSYIQERR